MNDEERYRRGANARRKILGDAWVGRAVSNKNAFNTEWQDFITRCAWGEIWTRPHFDERTRRALVIGTMMAIGRWEELRMHVRAARRGRLLSRRYQGDRSATGGLLRRAGGQSRFSSGRRGARGAREIRLSSSVAVQKTVKPL